MMHNREYVPTEYDPDFERVCGADGEIQNDEEDKARVSVGQSHAHAPYPTRLLAGFACRHSSCLRFSSPLAGRGVSF